jgi:hypothetical protein
MNKTVFHINDENSKEFSPDDDKINDSNSKSRKRYFKVPSWSKIKTQ